MLISKVSSKKRNVSQERVQGDVSENRGHFVFSKIGLVAYNNVVKSSESRMEQD